MITQTCVTVPTNGRGTYDLTSQVTPIVLKSGIEVGLCHLFCHHTSASLLLCENADPQVRRDLEAFLSRMVPDGDGLFRHTDEGPDDMPAHIRSILTGNELTIPISRGRCSLGTWQGIYLYEHRTQNHQRRVTITMTG